MPNTKRSVVHAARAVLPGALLVVAVARCGPGSSTVVHDAAVPAFVVDNGHPLNVADGRKVGGFRRLAWAGGLSDGTLVVADGPSAQVSFFPLHGTAFVAGGKGEGPGEFPYINDAGAGAGDSTLVLATGRLSFFDASGNFQRSVPLPYPGQGPEFVGVLGDSVLILRYWSLGYTLEGEGLRLDSTTFVAVDLSDGTLRHRFRLPDKHSYLHQAADQQVFWTFPPFFGRTAAAAMDSVIVWGMGNKPMLYLLDESGRRLDSIGVAIPTRRLEQADINAAKAERLARPRNNTWVNRNWRRMFDDLDFPHHHPFFDRLVVGAGGLLWLRSPGRTPEDSVRWWAEERTGRPRKMVVASPDIDIVQFMDSTVVAIRKDENDVQTVLVLRLVPVELESSLEDR